MNFFGMCIEAGLVHDKVKARQHRSNPAPRCAPHWYNRKKLRDPRMTSDGQYYSPLLVVLRANHGAGDCDIVLYIELGLLYTGI